MQFHCISSGAGPHSNVRLVLFLCPECLTCCCIYAAAGKSCLRDFFCLFSFCQNEKTKDFFIFLSVAPIEKLPESDSPKIRFFPLPQCGKQRKVI